MAKIQFLTILLVVTCFLGGVVSVTDKEFGDLVTFVHRQVKKFEIQSTLIEHLREENKDLVAFVHRQAEILEEQSGSINEQAVINARQSATIDKQSTAIKAMMEKIQRQEALIEELTTTGTREALYDGSKVENSLIQNMTIEERVTILENQVVEIEEDLTGLDQDVNFLFDEQVIQDERLFSLEQTSNGIIGELDLIEDELENLQDTTLALDFRVTVLEENGGGDGNSSVAELEVRVESLEGMADDHETRISAAEIDINDLEGTTSDLETRLTAAEENIQGLQMTDVELDARVTALEENGGGGNSLNDTVVFHTVLTSYDTIPTGTAVLFNQVVLNEGDGYDSESGTFTVPPGGDGFYYFSSYFHVTANEYALFDIQINGAVLCSAFTDQQEVGYHGQAACSAATYATEGDEVQVVYRDGTDTTTLVESTVYYYNGFTGFRI